LLLLLLFFEDLARSFESESDTAASD